ncbi:hypothetical protein FGLOB1_6033 [Fusarium globosum]|uniref:Uncharacterized protein n=1 Tax=Fusarium globosum TaxID=78864 RepID=A0A8H6DBG0_9HYPO|nr:hypothetical protein FGLOB1_6033 [Fusarium globosum]
MSISSAAIATLEEYEFDPKQGFARLGPGDALEARSPSTEATASFASSTRQRLAALGGTITTRSVWLFTMKSPPIGRSPPSNAFR